MTTDMGHVYFALNPKNKTVKIGWSGHVAARMAGLRWQFGHQVQLIGCVQAIRAAEKVIHARFRSHRVEGEREWFYMHDAVIKFIQASGLSKVELYLVMSRSKTPSITAEFSLEYSLWRLSEFPDEFEAEMAGRFWRTKSWRRHRFISQEQIALTA